MIGRSASNYGDIVVSGLLECFDVLDLQRSLWDRRSPHGLSTESLGAATSLLLIHGTSSEQLERIREQGILPRSAGIAPILDNLTAHSDFVYLGSRLDPFYLQRAVEFHGGAGAIVVVEVSRQFLEPDENAISQIDAEAAPEVQLLRSLQFGACRHNGVVSPGAIRGFFRQDGTRL